MKKITYILTILLLTIIPLHSAEKKDCSDLKKFSKAFVAYKANNIEDYQKKTWSKKD